jgi:hypothetical protein
MGHSKRYGKKGWGKLKLAVAIHFSGSTLTIYNFYAKKRQKRKKKKKKE